MTTARPEAAAARGAAVVCQAASLLLQYPDESVRERLPLVAAAVAELPPGPARTALTGFLDHFTATPPRDLAEHYVATLDRRRRCCLYLTWWTDGETRRRGQSLADLKDRYRRGGLEPGDRELPDFLPLVLEYAATGDLADGLALLQEHRAGLELLRLALLDEKSPYAGPVTAVCALLPGPSPKDRAEARRLARSGPPGESVGLEPYGPGAHRPETHRTGTHRPETHRPGTHRSDSFLGMPLPGTHSPYPPSAAPPAGERP